MISEQHNTAEDRQPHVAKLQEALPDCTITWDEEKKDWITTEDAEEHRGEKKTVKKSSLCPLWFNFFQAQTHGDTSLCEHADRERKLDTLEEGRTKTSPLA